MTIFHDVEQGSDEWYAMRAGKPTASEFSRIVTSKGEESKSRYGYALTLAGELFAGQRLDGWAGNGWTERGKEIEADAIAKYEFLTDATVERAGFVTGDDGAYGCSPDGLVGSDGLVEVKCLKAENHISAILYHKKNGCPPPDYVQQTQGEMLVTGRRWVDLIFYHPQLPLLVIRQEPILPVVAGLIAGLAALIAERDVILSVLKGNR